MRLPVRRADLAQAIHAPCIVAYTSSGTTASRIARTRPDVAILAVTPDEAWHGGCAFSGVLTASTRRTSTPMRRWWSRPKHLSRSEGLAQSPEFIVVVAGVPFGTAGPPTIFESCN